MKSDREEFLEIIANYQGILHKVNYIYFKDKSDREDNFQEVVYQLWKSFSKLKNVNNLASWIYTVAINTSISKFKKSKRIEYYQKLPDIIDSSDVFEETSLNEDIQILLSAIYNLNEIDKSIMLLYLEEKSYDEIAEIIGISKTNVGVRISRAKDLLKQNLKKLAMENDELKTTWRKIDENISPNSKEELNRILLSKTKKIMSKYLYFIGISGIICIGVIIFLAITMMNRWNDLFYRSINMLLILYTIYSLYSSIIAFTGLKNNKANLPLKDWLKQRISSVSDGLNSKIVFYILPVICMLLILSIHVYFEGKPFLDVIKTEESIIGLIIGFVIGLTVAFISLKQIRNQQKNNLDLLKEIYSNLNE